MTYLFNRKIHNNYPLLYYFANVSLCSPLDTDVKYSTIPQKQKRATKNYQKFSYDLIEHYYSIITQQCQNLFSAETGRN